MLAQNTATPNNISLMQIPPPDTVLKLYNDKLTLSKYTRPEVRYKYYDRKRKQHVKSGELSKWTFEDTERRGKSSDASLRRTHRLINELSSRNRFHFFLTITFNRMYVNAASAEEAHAAFKRILKRLAYHFKGIAYLSVPEFHEDLANIHYHVMINFTKIPHLKYKGLTPKGHPYYTIQDNFKKEDCFLTVEKLSRNNNTAYLTKYLTKGHEFPLHRKFGCSRGLNRSRLLEKVYIKRGGDWSAKKRINREYDMYGLPKKDSRFEFNNDVKYDCHNKQYFHERGERFNIDVDVLKDIALSEGFTVSYLDRSSKTCTLVYRPPDAHPAAPSGAAGVDLSIKDIKGENLDGVFVRVLKKINLYKQGKLFTDKIIRKTNFNGLKYETVIGSQLNFDWI